MGLAELRRHPALQRVLKNFGLLLGGRAAGGLLAFAATALSARALGPEGFGVVALVHAYILVIRGVVNIKPLEAIVRYGVPLVDDEDYAGLTRLLRVSLVFDVATSLVGCVLAVAVVALAAPALGWSNETATIAQAYSLVLLLSGIATASGLLRVFDRFDAVSSSLVLANAWRLLGVGLAILVEPTVAAIAAVWASSQALQYLATLYFGWQVARARIPESAWRGPLDVSSLERAHPGIWRFLNVVYWQSTLDLVPKSFGTVLAGTLLGTEGAALFRIAREFANVVAKPALLVRQAIYPDLTRLRHRGDQAFVQVIITIAAISAGPALLLTLASLWLGAPVLELTVGTAYVGAAGLLSWLVGSATLDLAAAPLRPAAYALGVGGAILRVQACAAAGYIALFYLLTPVLGVSGPGVATFALSLGLLLGMVWAVHRALQPSTRA